MEKDAFVDQNAAARFERVRAYVAARPALFAARGTVVATSRTYRGRRLGPHSLQLSAAPRLKTWPI